MSADASILSRRKVLALATAAAASGVAPQAWAQDSPLTNQAEQPRDTEPRLGRVAPPWDITEWINGDAGNVDTNKGTVVVIDFFQLWCPGCNRFSGPLMQNWQQTFAKEIDAGQLKLIKIHTVFEGRNYQTVAKLKSYLKEKKITMPVGVDRHIGEARVPETMRRYRTRGTPEVAIIGADGIIRFQHFGYFPAEIVENGLRRLMEHAKS